ncbi:MAG: DEAD/DEAH box helicase [Actinobacteria bacterium]|nr:DEAD/DEAH box helicase [Actinomycetota bacterium]
MPSPAERYAAAVTRAQVERSEVGAFAAGYVFGLDDFQVRACQALESGLGVLVAAPTGSGKTVVGEFAIHLALSEGRKCFYTTPIKALSNQKYNDLVARHGAASVGLLTGDNSINGEAPIVVMTTEVLRNMLYAGSSTLGSLGYVVMDEVHYLADRFRGAVWEEVIIHLPESVTVVALSATVSNAEEFGAWLATVRGQTAIVVEEHRPVPLWQHVMAGPRMYDLFIDDDQNIVNPDLVRLAREEDRNDGGRAGRGRGPRDRQRGRGPKTPWRSEVVERLERDGLLPAIYFLFSRAGCDEAVRQCLHAGLRLTSTDERRHIRATALAATMELPDEDLAALGFDEWLEALERGLAAHHAGLLPVFKEIVENLFQLGMIKVVFATETLALGINMPAKSVVLERLVKWNGETHVDLTPGEYTQLTGRAGRRGIDVEGHAVVLWQPGLDPRSLAGLASTRTYPLRSSFQPSYNMAVNLVSRMGRHAAREVLETSFAQFQADRSVVGLATELRRVEEARDGYRQAMSCHLGDFWEYAELRESLSRREKDINRRAAAERRDAAEESWLALRQGDIFLIATGRRAGPAVVLDSRRHRGPREANRPMVLTGDGQVRRMSVADTSQPVEAFTRIDVPKGFVAKDARARRDLVAALRAAVADIPHDARRRRASTADDEQIQQMRAALRQHPCHGCSDREVHARWAERYHRAARQIHDIERKVEGRTNSIAKRFDHVCEVLTDLGYLTSSGDAAQVTDSGRMLMRLYTESDLMAAQSLLDGDWSALTPAELAAVCSAVVYESRRPDDEATPATPTAAVRLAVERLGQLWAELHELESRHRLDIIRKPDAGLVDATYRWARGANLLQVLTHSDITAGDFVRWTRQVIDLLGQIAQALDPDDPLRAVAHEAADLVNRGVVAYSSAV